MVMKNAKKFAILALVCLNLALVGGLVHVNMAPAEAGLFKTTNYVVMTGHINSDTDALYIIDLATQKLAAWRWDINQKRMVIISGRTLTKDFKTRP